MTTGKENLSLDARLQKLNSQIKNAVKDAMCWSGLQDTAKLRGDSFHVGVQLFGPTTDVVGGVRESLDEMEVELGQLIVDIENRICEGAAIGRREIEKEVTELELKVGFLRECCAIRLLLDESLCRGSPSLAPDGTCDFSKAASQLIEAEEALGRAHQSICSKSREESKSIQVAKKIVGVLRESIRQQKCSLVGEVCKIWKSCVSLSDDAIGVRSTNQLDAVYDCFETLSFKGIDKMFTGFFEELVSRVLVPLMNVSKVSTIRIFESEGNRAGTTQIVPSLSTGGTFRRLQWNAKELESKETERSVASFIGDGLEALGRVISFVAEHVLRDKAALNHIFGSHLFGLRPQSDQLIPLPGFEHFQFSPLIREQFSQQILALLENWCIPESIDPVHLDYIMDLAEKLQAHLDSFTGVITSCQVISDLKVSNQLFTFPESMPTAYVEKRRGKILAAGRDLVLNSDYNNTRKVGGIPESVEDRDMGLSNSLEVFCLPRASVSETALSLLELIHCTMKEATHPATMDAPNSFKSLSVSLFKTTRDLLDLYRAIVPAKLGDDVAAVPRTAAIVHNDCVFLAHHCLTLGLQYKKQQNGKDDSEGNGIDATPSYTFVDFVPLFRNMADQSMGDMLESRAAQLVENIGSRLSHLASSLRSHEMVAEWSDVQNAVQAGVQFLSALAKMWKPLLADQVRTRSLGYLVDVLLSKILEQVTKAEVISVSACHFLGAQMVVLENGVRALDIGSNGSQLWERFLAINRFLGMSLDDIHLALAEGVFRYVEGPEILKLVEACFSSDNPKRDELIRLLATNS